MSRCLLLAALVPSSKAPVNPALAPRTDNLGLIMAFASLASVVLMGWYIRHARKDMRRH